MQVLNAFFSFHDRWKDPEAWRPSTKPLRWLKVDVLNRNGPWLTLGWRRLPSLSHSPTRNAPPSIAAFVFSVFWALARTCVNVLLLFTRPKTHLWPTPSIVNRTPDPSAKPSRRRVLCATKSAWMLDLNGFKALLPWIQAVKKGA